VPKIRAVIFDCYRTLIDIRTNEAKEEIFRYLSLYLQYYGANISGANLKAAIALEKERCLQTKTERYPEVDLEIVFERILEKEGLDNPFLAESCCKLFRLLSRERFQLFPDTLPVLSEMKRSRYPLAVVSDAQKVFCLDEGRILGLNQFFDHTVLSTQFGFRKPDPRLFAVACALLNAPPAEAVYIGNDPETDVIGAKQIGMWVVLVARDKAGRNKAAKMTADFYANDLWESWRWIKSKEA
jgi:putative hydrolase of the HAD superfamily